MLIPFSIIVLASQLVIAVVDDVPKFDIARGCNIDSNAAFSPSLGMSGTIKRCMDEEQKAKDQLQAQWSGYVNSDRTMCGLRSRGSYKQLSVGNAAKGEREREIRSCEEATLDHQRFLPAAKSACRSTNQSRASLRKKRANNDAPCIEGKTSVGSAE
jgi:hypothetical protein